METQLEIAWHGLQSRPGLEAQIGQRVARLERLAGRLTSCRVAITAPHQRHRIGNRYDVRVEARAPSAVFMADREPGDAGAHESLHVAVRDAFDAIERQVKRWNEAHGGRPEVHAVPLRGRIDNFDPERDGGQILLTDGRLVYFHRNSVAEGRYEALSSGDAVEVSLDPGRDSAHGPHASHVQPVAEVSFPPPTG